MRTDLIDHVFAFRGKSEIPLAADWYGDGVDEVGAYRPETLHSAAHGAASADRPAASAARSCG